MYRLIITHEDDRFNPATCYLESEDHLDQMMDMLNFLDDHDVVMTEGKHLDQEWPVQIVEAKCVAKMITDASGSGVMWSGMLFVISIVLNITTMLLHVFG